MLNKDIRNLLKLREQQKITAAADIKKKLDCFVAHY